jgi:hypothetical protein
VAPETKYFFGDFLTFDFGKSKFEGLFGKAFIHLFKKKDAIIVLKKIFDLLENNGAALITTTLHNTSEEGFFEKTDYNRKMKRYRKKWMDTELFEEIRKVGFKIYYKNYYTESNKGKDWITLILVKPSPLT